MYAAAVSAAILFWVSFLPSIARAQAGANARLSGMVRTEQGIPVPAATVRVENLALHRAWMSWTDANGKYQFPQLPPGQYEIEATMMGFAPDRKRFAVSGNATLELTLHVATLAQLEAPAESGERHAHTAESRPEPGVSEKPAAGSPGREEARAGRPGAGRGGPGNPPAGSVPPEGRRGGREATAAAGLINAVRSGMGGFQQVNVSGELGSEEAQAQAQIEAVPGQQTSSAGSSAPVATASLGEASSSDSFLMSGSVGRSVTALPGASLAAGGPGGRGMFGGGFPGGGLGGGPGGRGFGGRGGPGRFRGRGRRGPGRAAGSVAELYARQRFLRRSVNRVRFNFYNRYENSVWDARPYSLNQVTPPKLSHYDERFGGSLGGPLYIPHVYDGRDRAFVFGNYSYNRQQSPIDSYASVPTPTERSGNFCDRSAQLYDPTSNLAGPRTSLGCELPPSMINSAAQGLLAYFPEPNLPGFVQNFHLQAVVPRTSNFVNVHLLHTISPRLSLNAGYNLQSSHADTLTDFPAFLGSSRTRNQNVTLSLNQNWTPRLGHVTGLNFNRSRVETLSNNAYGQDIAEELGIGGVSTSPINFGVPQVSFTNFTGLSDPVPSLMRNQTWRFNDALTYTLTNHTLSGGFELRRLDWNKYGDPTPRGAFTFTGLMTSQLDSQGQPVAGTGLDFADFLLGLPQSTNLRYGSAASYFRSWGYAAYVQDDWRVKPRFSVSYGLRYDYVRPPIELFNAISNLDLNADISQVAVVVPGQVAPYSGALPRSLVRNDPNNFAPRFGFAWQPFRNDPTIVRGGYSIFYNESIYQQLAYSMANQPPFAQAQLRFTTTAQVLTLQDGFPAQPLTQARNTIAVDPNYQVGYAQIWDLSIERQLGGGWLLDAYYTGTKGTHLDLQRAPNRAPPGSPLTTDEQRRIADAGGFVYDTFGASSIYHAVHFRVRKRPTHGLMLMADYAFGKSIDNASSIGGGAPIVVQNDLNFRAERGLSSFDIRHQFRGFFFYQLPFGPRMRWARGGWAERLLGNYRLNGIVTANSGTPFTARVLGAASDNTGTGSNFSERADQIGSGCGGPGTTAEFFPTGAFVLPPPGQFGDAARNSICGPGMFTVNLGLGRGFIFGSDRTRRLDVRWEVQNVFNTPHFTGLNTVVNSATYGLVTSAGNMRTMDLTMRVSF